MNSEVEENEFRGKLQNLLENMNRAENSVEREPYANAEQEKMLEHTTRAFFFNNLLKILGWRLDIDGDVKEEVRIKDNTTKFIDYVGINKNTQAPVMILEVKAWDKPFVSAKEQKQKKSYAELIVEAIKHINKGGLKKTAPVIGDWHDYLEQLGGYVKKSNNVYKHPVPKAVLASGKWLIVFTDPVATFCDGKVDEGQFQIFSDDDSISNNDYVSNAHIIYRLLSRAHLAKVTPVSIRSSQLRKYFTAKNISAVFRSMIVNYGKNSFDGFSPIPLIQIYPALLVQRDDDVLFTVIDNRIPMAMNLTEDNVDNNSLADHIDSVTEASQTLLNACSTQFSKTKKLPISDLDKFPGFPDEDSKNITPFQGAKRKFVKPITTSSDQWLVVTGKTTHFMLKKPNKKCRFHEWSECRKGNKEIGERQIIYQETKPPRSFFKDGERYHCAHQTVEDRREDICHIAPIDARTCCRACIFQNSCWSSSNLKNLPCGK